MALYTKMKQIKTVVASSLFILVLSITYSASAEVWIPEYEYAGYFDSDGIYTVVGAVKNSEEYAVIPTVQFSIRDGDKLILESYPLPVAGPLKDIPFKIKFAQVFTENPVLEEPKVTFVQSTKDYTDIEVVYGSTLFKHHDGHVSGFIMNNGDSPSYNVKVYALIHGEGGKFMDVGKSIETIEKIEPGEKKEFSIYPDPQFATKVSYYSCFAIGDDMVIPTYVIKDGGKFNFRYKTEGYIDTIKFDDETNTMSLFVRNPWPMPSYANIEFPIESQFQKFTVYQNDKQIESLQSMDEDTWHIVFDLQPQSSSQILISGFGGKDETDSNMYYLLGIIPAAAIIAGVFIQKKKKHQSDNVK